MEGSVSKDLKVWVNGTFDVLHRGHIELLEYASKFGIVRVGIDTDERVRTLKGKSRPINRWSDRAYLLRSIKFVDSVVPFSSDNELEIEIALWGPKYMVVGSDYKDKKVIGSHLCDNVLFFDRIESYSSTKIINYDKNISGR
jgi:rfaE bifunctional protein nucleotidyltransferase chain/domain